MTRARTSAHPSPACWARAGRTNGPAASSWPCSTARTRRHRIGRAGGRPPPRRPGPDRGRPRAASPIRRRCPAAAVGALAASNDRDAIAPDLIAALDDESGDVRPAAAVALAAFPTAPAGLLEVLDTGSVRAQEAALVALRGHGPDVRAPLIAWTRARLERAADLRRERRPGPASRRRVEPRRDAGHDAASPDGVPHRHRRPSRGGHRGPGARRARRPRHARSRRRHPPVAPLRRPRSPRPGDGGARLGRRSRAVRRPRPAARGRGPRCAGCRCRPAPSGR